MLDNDLRNHFCPCCKLTYIRKSILLPITDGHVNKRLVVACMSCWWVSWKHMAGHFRKQEVGLNDVIQQDFYIWIIPWRDNVFCSWVGRGTNLLESHIKFPVWAICIWCSHHCPTAVLMWAFLFYVTSSNSSGVFNFSWIRSPYGLTWHISLIKKSDIDWRKLIYI